MDLLIAGNQNIALQNAVLSSLPPPIVLITTPWTFVVAAVAYVLAFVLLAQALAVHFLAYRAAPREISTLRRTVDSFTTEIERYGRLSMTHNLLVGDKLRLAMLLQETQRASDELRSELDRLLDASGVATETKPATLLSINSINHRHGPNPVAQPKFTTRLFWRSIKKDLDERIRHLDMLQMRFLVSHHSSILAVATPSTTPIPADRTTMIDSEVTVQPISNSGPTKDPSKPKTPKPTPIVTTISPCQTAGWVGVMQELQRSPKMAQRHASIDSGIS